MNTFWRVITRKKFLDPLTTNETGLARVLNTFDLTALGVGSTLGVGVYVLAGHVAKDTAGPAVVLSFLIAAIASVFAGLCYAEFGARAPRAGSAYIYSYVCVGELVAFVIGWNLILEYIIGSASVARGLSLYLDTLLNNTLKDTFAEIAPINISFMSQYFDFFAFSIAALLSVALAFGMKESTLVNNIFTGLNIFIVIFVIIAGSIKTDTKNWSLPAPNSTIVHGGNGGFFPFGVEGMIKGAATCFYGFVGFDCIATTGEEVKNPQKAIPRSIILSLLIIFLAYFGTSTVVTLMVPYYFQDPNAPIPHAFEEIGWNVAKWIVSIGGIFGLCASLFGAMFPLPRIIYAMASDGLVFRFLGTVNVRFHTPVVGTLLAGLLTGLMAALFDLSQLVNMMSIGTLLAYTIVAACVLLLRYATDEDRNYTLLRTSDSDIDLYSENTSHNYDALTNAEQSNNEYSDASLYDQEVNFWNMLKQTFNCSGFQDPTKVSEKVVTIEVFIYCILCLLLGLCAMYLIDPISHGKVWAIVLTSIIGFFLIIILMSLATQPTSKRVVSFKVHPVPLIPALSILVNIYLMLMLDENTWIRFGVWMAIGLPMYYFSIRHYPKSAQNHSVCSVISDQNNLNGIKQNGHINNGFVNDAGGDGIIKNNIEDTKIDISLDVKESHNLVTENNDEKTDPMSVDLALALLDDVLSKEEFINYNRQTSFETISTASNIPVEQNVVALVHCEDTSSIPVTPQSDIQINDQLKTDIDNLNEFVEVNNNENNKLNESESDLPIENKHDSETANTIPLPPPLPTFNLTQEIPKIPRLTSEISKKQLKAVTLTPIKIKSKPVIPPADYSPEISDDNMRVSSDHAKLFKGRLESIFKAKLPYQFGIQVPESPNKTVNGTFLNNEDVIKDSIKPNNEVKQKLKDFLTAHLEITKMKIPVTVENTNVKINAEESIKPNQNGVINTETITPRHTHYGHNNVDILEHKKRMANNLRSIRLRKVDSFKID